MVEDYRGQNDKKSNWCWRTSREATQQTFSVLAALEVALAVFLYWAYALWAHTQVHLIIGAVVAPFLLLRSPESSELGRRWFRKVDFVLIDQNWISKQYSRAREREGVIRVIAVSCAIIMALVIGLMGALVIRILATLLNIPAGIRSLSENWWRTLFATDIFTKPEIVPGHATESSLYNYMSDLPSVFRDFLSTYKEKRSIVGFVEFINSCFGLIFVFGISLVPSYVYRLSIKSTAWVHWPLAYVSRPLQYADDPEEVRMRLWGDPREWLRRVAMIITLAGAFAASVPAAASVKAAFSSGALSVVEYAVLIDVKSLFGHPWRAAALISAIITLILSWYGFELTLLVKRSTVRPDRLTRATKWAAALEYAMRIRDVCGWIFWALVFVHAGLWLLPSTSWIGGYPREVLRFVYGDYLPPGLV